MYRKVNDTLNHFNKVSGGKGSLEVDTQKFILNRGMRIPENKLAVPFMEYRTTHEDDELWQTVWLSYHKKYEFVDR